jgi:hypothetical protein
MRYIVFMPKVPISVTLDADNVRWLQGQTVSTRTRGVSETLDRLVTGARLGGRVRGESVRSVVGTVDIHPDDPALDRADHDLRALFDASMSPPIAPRRVRREARPARPPRRGQGRSRG